MSPPAVTISLHVVALQPSMAQRDWTGCTRDKGGQGGKKTTTHSPTLLKINVETLGPPPSIFDEEGIATAARSAP